MRQAYPPGLREWWGCEKTKVPSPARERGGSSGMVDLMQRLRSSFSTLDKIRIQGISQEGMHTYNVR